MDLDALQIDPISFFVVLEAVMLFLVVALVFFLRSRVLAGRVESLKRDLKKAQDVETPEPIGFDQYLRDEILRNEGLTEQAAAASDADEKAAAELLALRKQFLELELAAHAQQDNPVQFQATLAGGMGELIERLRPEPETVTETESAEVAIEGAAEAEGDESQTQARARIDTQQAEFDRLRDVINNQQDAMAALREQLKAHESEIQDLDTIMAKLDDFERHDVELQQCLKVLEEENQRLKSASSSGGTQHKIAPMAPAQLTGLQNMLNNQQDTINNLQSMIQELAPEAGKAKELEAALGNIQRANQELNSCVAVLEDENAMLRAELEAINAQLEAEEKAAAAQTDAAPAPEEEASPEADPDVSFYIIV